MYIIGTACNINDLTHITEMEATYRLTRAKEMQWRALYAYFLRARRRRTGESGSVMVPKWKMNK
jgi:hypothetical protein